MNVAHSGIAYIGLLQKISGEVPRPPIDLLEGRPILILGSGGAAPYIPGRGAYKPADDNAMM